MSHRVCPWWIGYVLASPLRRLHYHPSDIVAPHIRPGMTVLEPGPGMGYFTLEIARLVGPSGRVVAVDIQPKMLNGLRRKAAKAGLLDRIDIRQAQPDSLGIGDVGGAIDFVFTFAVLHEMPSADAFFRQAAQALKTGGVLLLAEPSGHVKQAEFDAELSSAAAAGLDVASRPAIRGNHAALLRKP
jgi:ubiquinone/menaquinone biosynthesis C-methylase UbiE